ncbi:MAG: tetratricopeptide repeat protein, partial [Anaerolineales bacterium]|nr:tetratricopeptide repeat protein [Anaerolineales bacterium]
RIRASLSLPHHNLPPASTPFVGREAELAQVRQQLADPGCRLLTLLGPGGIGKTRLALAAAAGLAAAPPVRYLNGVRYVSLVPVDAPADLAAAIAAACGLTFQGSDPPLAQLIRHLADHEMLLLLDNFEHLIDDQGADGVDLLAALLAETPGVTYLVTSRERLNLQEEWVFDLAGLACPPADAADPDRYSAMQLFRQQAARLRRQFAPDAADLQAMAEVCRLLDGMPLGIELAAAWVRQYSCTEIARQVQADLDFLHTSLRNVPPRHRSLAAVFEHSWRLLSPAEQAVFARLSLFRGGFTAEAAAEVAEAPRDVLNGLVDKSLLRFGNGRYDLHELLQQYAAEKLAGGAADAAAVAQRHAAFYLRFAAQHDSSRNTAAQQAMAEAFANVRQAWQWAAQHGQAAVLAETAVSLHEFYSVQSRFQEGIDAYQFALDQLRALPETTPGLAVALCELWGRKARLHITLGQLEAAQQALDEAMVYLPAVENSERHSALLGYAAITTYYAGDYARAAALAVESMRLAEETGDQDGVAFGLNFLGSCAKVQGDYAAARDYFQRSADLYTALQDDLGAAMSVNNLGNVAQAAGDYATAQAHYLACSAVFKKHNHVHGAATTLSNAGKLAIRLGDYAQAEALLAESLALKRELQDTRGAAVALSGLGEVSLASGALDDARAHMLEALRLADEAGDTKLVLEVLGGLGALAARQGEDETAVRRLQFVLGHPATSQEVREQAEQVLARLRPSPAALQDATTWARQQSVQTLMRYRLEGES